MELYIVVIEDMHTDVTVHPFSDKEKAITEAKRIAKEYCRHEEDYEEHDYGKDDGWLFYAQYSCESDHVRVVTTTLDKAI
jgi:hypothetical protein